MTGFCKVLLCLATICQAFSQDPTRRTGVPASPAVQALLTLYSPRGSGMLELPGRKSWGGRLWVDHHKIGLVTPGQFLTLRLTEGEHSLAGERSSFVVRESSLQTPVSLHLGQRYFMRLVVDSKAIAGLGPTRWVGEAVTCQDAYQDAATSEPVKLKHIEKSALDYIARESYFPECPK